MSTCPPAVLILNWRVVTIAAPILTCGGWVQLAMDASIRPVMNRALASALPPSH
jgi:hypothetical protein